MESEREQLMYGDRCTPHGHQVGTPSGADFMCGLCEAGLTRWVMDRYWGIVWVGNDLSDWEVQRQAHSSPYKWQDSDSQEVKDKVWASFVTDSRLDVVTTGRFKGQFFKAVVYAEGEWDYELEMTAATEIS